MRAESARLRMEKALTQLEPILNDKHAPEYLDGPETQTLKRIVSELQSIEGRLFNGVTTREPRP